VLSAFLGSTCALGLLTFCLLTREAGAFLLGGGGTLSGKAFAGSSLSVAGGCQKVGEGAVVSGVAADDEVAVDLGRVDDEVVDLRTKKPQTAKRTR